MQKSKSLFRVEVITFTALLVALQVVLGNIVQIPSISKQFNLGFLPIAVAGALMGPIPAAIVGALGDIIGAVLFPQGAYFPGFTLTNILVGIIYGFILHRNRPNVLAVILSVLAAGVVNLFLNTLWLSVFIIKKAYPVLLVSRAAPLPVELPVQMVIIFATLLALSRIKLPAEMRLDRNFFDLFSAKPATDAVTAQDDAAAGEPTPEEAAGELASEPVPEENSEEVQNESAEKADS